MLSRPPYCVFKVGVAIGSVQFVYIMYDQSCRLNYEFLKGLFVGRNKNFVRKFDEHWNENEYAMKLRITTQE